MTADSPRHDALHIVEHGRSGPLVIILHGGPGAPGSTADLARGLADGFRVLEPWQRAGGGEPLTVARHVADLDRVIRTHCPADRPALVGHSWGAMLALATAAEHPERVGPLVLVGCGTFSPEAREQMQRTLEQRMGDDARRQLDRLDRESLDPDERTRRTFQLIHPLLDVDPIVPADKPGHVDVRGNRETWSDALRLQAEGVHPAAFRRIRSPVLMLHGADDPHPGRMIRDSLQPAIPQLEYRELARCGHEPWRERTARETFFGILRDWLAKTIPQA